MVNGQLFVKFKTTDWLDSCILAPFWLAWPQTVHMSLILVVGSGGDSGGPIDDCGLAFSYSSSRPYTFLVTIS